MANPALMKILMDRNHPLTPFSDRAVFSGLIFLASIVVATLVIHFSEGWSVVNSFYYIAMVTTTNGAPYPPTTAAVEVFTSLWAYFSMILLASTLTISLGPLIGYLVKEGGSALRKAEEKVESIKK